MNGPLKGGMGAAATASHADVSGAQETPSTTKVYSQKKPLCKLALRVIRDDGGPSFIVQGQTAKAVRALVLAGSNGVTALEVNSWAFRFAAYCHCLKRKGLDIETRKEAHTGGWHGRHVLHTLVRLEACS